jgi:hypothetical protein
MRRSFAPPVRKIEAQASYTYKMSHPMAVAREIRKEVILAMLYSGYDMPPEEAGQCHPLPQCVTPILVSEDADAMSPADYGDPTWTALSLRIVALLRPYYKTLQEERKEAWKRLAVGLNDDEWNEMWSRHCSRDAVAAACRSWVQNSGMFPLLQGGDQA